MSRITGIGAPTRHTKGKVGDTYLDSATNDLYKCVQSYYSYDKLANEETILYSWIDLNRQDILTAGGGKDELITFELIPDEATRGATSPYSATEITTYYNAGIIPLLVYDGMVMLPAISEGGVCYEYSYAHYDEEYQSVETNDLTITINDDKTVVIDNNLGDISVSSGANIIEATQDPHDYTKYTASHTPEEIMNLEGSATLIINKGEYNEYYVLTEANSTRAVFVGTKTDSDVAETKYAIVNADKSITFDEFGTLIVGVSVDSNNIGHHDNTITKDYIASHIRKRPIMLSDGVVYYTLSGYRAYRYEFTSVDVDNKKLRCIKFFPGGDDSSTSTTDATWVYSEVSFS